MARSKSKEQIMELFHNSPAEIKNINRFGKFEYFLFFASSSCHYGDATYTIEIDEDEIIDCNSFFYREDYELLNDIVAEVMDRLGCDEDEAQEYLSQRAHAGDSDTDWWIQLMTAKCAEKLGYRGVEVPDEHGTSFIINMLGREAELTPVEVK